MSKDNVTVGFVGLGTMGGRMAANVQRAGFKLIVHDLHRQAASHHLADGAIWAESPRALAREADVIFSSLPEPSDVEAVALGPDGLVAGIKPGAAYFDLSTNSPSVVKKLNAAFAERGAHMLDAPVSGGPAGAASRKLAIWVGGDENVFKEHKAVLDAIGDKAAYIGPIGSATVAKLVHNMSGYAIVCALAETFTMGVKAGIEPLALWQAVRQGAAGRRFTFDALIDQFLPGTYDPPAFALKLAHKDVSLANALGRELGVPMRMCNLALAEMTEALARGWGGRDSRSVMLLQQERAGVEIAVDPERLRAALAPAVSKDGCKARLTLTVAGTSTLAPSRCKPSLAACEAGLAHDVAQADDLGFHERPQFVGRGRVDRDQPLALDELVANIRFTQNHAQVRVKLVDDRAWRLGGRYQHPP